MQVSDLFGHHLAERVEYLEKYADFGSLKASIIWRRTMSTVCRKTGHIATLLEMKRRTPGQSALDLQAIAQQLAKRVLGGKRCAEVHRNSGFVRWFRQDFLLTKAGGADFEEF